MENAKKEKLSVRYAGDESQVNGGPKELKQFGHTFVKGEFRDVEVSAMHAAKLRGHPHFEIEGEEKPEVSEEEAAED